MEPGSAELSLYVAEAIAAPVAAAPKAPAAPPAVPGATRTASPAYLFVKRLLDIVLSLVALTLTMPIWLVVAALVRCTSHGPVLFRQPRVGRGGRAFTVLKFRSMCRDAEARLQDPALYDTYVATGYKLPVAHEFRVTRVGRFLRRSSLDELPQLLNVLRGDMSLVGPRPVVPPELGSYGDLVDCYLGVRPGLTGIWQVSGRSHIQFPERARLDRDYFHACSLRLDLAILARTPLAVLRGDGAY
jgi:lipopolysaccharide/colanic/teichoic acid biosynthesis glycosyltransferase